MHELELRRYYRSLTWYCCSTSLHKITSGSTRWQVSNKGFMLGHIHLTVKQIHCWLLRSYCWDGSTNHMELHTLIEWVWASPTLVRSRLNFVCTVCAYIHNYMYIRILDRSSWQMWPAQLVTHIARCYCHHMFRLLQQASVFISETTLKRGWREGVVAGTPDKRTAAFHCLCIATSLTLIPQCSSFT